MPITFCCLDAPARTWLRFGLLHLAGGRVGDRQVVPAQWMRDIVTPSPTNPNYGYFTWLGTPLRKCGNTTPDRLRPLSIPPPSLPRT